MNSDAPWPVGTEVAWYGPYDRSAVGTAVVEKIYKTGHLIIRGRRFRMFSAESAHETGDGYSKASVRRLTDRTRAEIAAHKKQKLAKEVAAWLERAASQDIPDDLLQALAAAMSATKQHST